MVGLGAVEVPPINGGHAMSGASSDGLSVADTKGSFSIAGSDFRTGDKNLGGGNPIFKSINTGIIAVAVVVSVWVYARANR